MLQALLRYAKNKTAENLPIRVVLSHQIVRITAGGFKKYYLLRGARFGLQQRGFSEWVEDLCRVPLTHNPLLKGLGIAFRGEIYDACEIFFTWCTGKQSGTPCTFLWKKRKIAKTARVFSRHDGQQKLHTISEKGQTEKSLILEGLWFYFHTWKHRMRLAPEESLAWALSKYYGSLGNFERALYFIENSLKSGCSPIHLKSAEYALHLRLSNKAIPPRLEKFIGYDNGYLKDFVCDAPFKRFDIVETGDVNVCCGHWLPNSIGRIDQGELDDVLNSDKAQIIRKSMTDGTYKYCNHLDCRLLAEGTIPRREALKDPVLINAIEKQDFKVDRVDDMLFAYYQTCNLACPSCRRDRIIERPSDNEAKALIMEQKLLPLLKTLKHVMLNVAGEVFASKPSRKMLEMITPETCPDLTIDLISNGMLFTEAEWNKFPGIHTKVQGVRISMDAARKDTFEKLRRFGVFDILTKNLAFLQRLRKEGVIKGLYGSFTYQVENFREMEEFVLFCRSFGFDRIIFEPLQNVGAFTDQEFRDRAVHKPYHPLFSEFLKVIRRPIFKQSDISHDFSNYEGFDKNRLLSENFFPLAHHFSAEGMVWSESEPWLVLETISNKRHRLLLNDSSPYAGTEHFTVELKPVGTDTIGIELCSQDGTNYGRILCDVSTAKILPLQSVTEYMRDMNVIRKKEGWLSISFSFDFKPCDAISLNFYLVNAQHQVEYKGNSARGFQVGSISAVTQHAIVPAMEAPMRVPA